MGEAGRRVLVCGGRDFNDRSLVFSTLDKLHDEQAISVVIEGGAKGADRLAADWAKASTRLESYPADWTRYGRRAGPIRNVQMLAEGNPDLVVAFPGGSGTAHMVSLARRHGVPVIVVPLPLKDEL